MVFYTKNTTNTGYKGEGKKCTPLVNYRKIPDTIAYSLMIYDTIITIDWLRMRVR